ncbi:hypothetical protein [Geodermatophilus sp. CPCC 206100]
MGRDGVLGLGPALDSYAQDCFPGTMDACDQLDQESLPGRAPRAGHWP